MSIWTNIDRIDPKKLNRTNLSSPRTLTHLHALTSLVTILNQLWMGFVSVFILCFLAQPYVNLQRKCPMMSLNLLPTYLFPHHLRLNPHPRVSLFSFLMTVAWLLLCFFFFFFFFFLIKKL